MQPFDVYIQILLSQALEPGFLAALQNEKGTTKFHCLIGITAVSISAWHAISVEFKTQTGHRIFGIQIKDGMNLDFI